MKIYEIYLDMWIFGGGLSRNKIWTKTACPDMSTFSKFRQKIKGFEIWKGFDGDLEHLNIWIFYSFNR